MQTAGKQKFIATICKVVVFCLVLGAVMAATAGILGMQDDMYTAHAYEQFYELPENTVDVVTIGSSGTREFYNVSEAYNHNGIACATLGSSNQPFIATKYLIQEAEKTQHPKVYVIECRKVTDEDNAYYADFIRLVSDSMHQSRNRIAFIDRALDLNEEMNPGSEVNRMEYYLPFLYYHNRWDDLTYHDFGIYSDVSWLGFSIYTSVQEMDGAPDLLSSYGTSDLTAAHQEELDEVLAYCKELHESQGTAFLFIDPIAWSDEETYTRTNTVREAVQAAGFPFIDTREWFEEMGFDLSTDFRDSAHINVHGSFKYTDFLADYLQQAYGLTDYRNDAVYDVWQQNYNQFMNMYHATVN